jgi:2',3'-cyclic-nucleotide 2'-phosphodiesterase (5'-nucleotidase family)
VKKAGINETVPALFLSLMLFFISGQHAGSAETVTLLLTSNLEGRFLPEIAGQETRDPLVLLGQSIIMESRKTKIVYFDLGNSFYPGALSKQNYGSPMIDFFNFFRCRATLVSSMDLRIGVSSLQFLQSRSRTELLSGNILKENNPLFKPYLIQEMGGRKVAFVGLSSKKILFDVAEKNIYKISIDDEIRLLGRIVDELRGNSVKEIIILSGLSYNINMKLLDAFPEIRLVICGGDQKGILATGRVVRVDTADRRSIITVPPDQGYCLLAFSMDEGITVSSVRFKKAAHHTVVDEQYDYFIDRITHWKKQFAEETGRVLTRAALPVRLEQQRLASLLQDYYNAEIAIIKNDTITPTDLSNNIKLGDILAAVQDNFTIYTYRLSGDDINELSDSLSDFTITGYRDKKIQGYPVVSNKKYLAVSTQTVFEEIRKKLKKKIKYRNTWKTIPDVIIEDLDSAKIVLKDDFRYLEKRFRYMVDFYLSAFYEASRVIVDNKIKIPVGESDQSYNKWGLEAKLDLTLYNSHNKLIFTPYINYSRQNELFLNNLLRGTLQYVLNAHPFINPYVKSQAETVVLPVRKASFPNELSTIDELKQYFDYRKVLRPVTIRETVGMSLQSQYVNGNLGCGLEKYVHDPVNPAVFGVELLLSFKYEFLKYLTYSLKLDSFVSLLTAGGKNRENNYFRSELVNALTVRVTDILGFSLKHRWYYYQNLLNNRHYSNSQIVTSCELKMDFKN